MTFKHHNPLSLNQQPLRGRTLSLPWERCFCFKKSKEKYLVYKDLQMKILILILGLAAFCGTGLAQYPYQPVGLWNYRLFDRGHGPWENIYGVSDQNRDGRPDFVVRMQMRDGNCSYLFYGGTDRQIPDLIFRPWIKPCGDVNEDGIIDFLTWLRPGGGAQGIKFGGGDADSACDVELPQYLDNSRRYEFSPAGDVNGDGLGDFIMSNTYRNDSLGVGITECKILLGGGDFNRWADWRIATDSLAEDSSVPTLFRTITIG